MLNLYVNLSEKIRKFAADESGVTAIEYGLIAAGIAVAIITAVSLLGDALSDMFDAVTAAI